MRTYGQYCPIARGAEIFAERWTPLIIRNLYLGCGNFSAILEGAPGLSRTLLSQRLKQLERLGVVELAPKPDGRGHHYKLTSAGRDLFTVCQSLGEWGARWLEIAPEKISTPLWPCGRCATRSAETGSRIDASSSVSTSPAGPAVSAIGYSSSSETPNLQDRPRLRRGPLHHGGSRSLRQMARRPAHLGPSHRRGPHPTRRPAVAGKSLPNLERPQHVRAHQAGLPRRRLTSSMRSPTAVPHYVGRARPRRNKPSGPYFGAVPPLPVVVVVPRRSSRRSWRPVRRASRRSRRPAGRS